MLCYTNIGRRSGHYAYSLYLCHGLGAKQRDIPIFGTTHADHLTSDIPCAPPMDDAMIAGNYEHETGFQIINHFDQQQLDYKEVEMILVGNHAPFVWGKDGMKSVYNSAVLEQVAKMAWLTEQINPDAARLKPALIKNITSASMVQMPTMASNLLLSKIYNEINIEK
ncbi:class II aldolase/adducin family protein [Sphingobacterium sp. E70]|uniref:class II aldolase/adducin family protein n=1 Tax=Sphingobacterium sp. E70 TaxID=2853439 RepID=UPI00211C0066|nr:class II aldolase/adducin family protein [Sphingobacterium sp. E70]ULT25118.1 class II aldolase/adducin family protein [Sphingobacterium sp. E70]